MEQTEKTTTGLTGSFGTVLRKAREAKGISLQAVAKELFIKERYLDALEHEDFDALPQQAFARGFATNYAKHLKLDHKAIVDSFNQAYPEDRLIKSVEDIEAPLRPMGTLHRDSGGRKLRINPFLLLGVIAVVILAVFLLRTINNAENNVQNSGDGTETQEQTMTGNEQLQGAALVSGNANLAASGSALNLSNAAQSTNQPAAAEDSVVQSAAGDDEIDLWIRGDTNVTVVDANGQTIMSGTHGRGGYTVTGKKPFKVSIDKADNVAVNLNKQPIKLASFTQNNQANFELK